MKLGGEMGPHKRTRTTLPINVNNSTSSAISFRLSIYLLNRKITPPFAQYIIRNYYKPTNKSEPIFNGEESTKELPQ